MKKLIAISTMLALLAGAAFAETAITGAIELQWSVVSGNTEAMPRIGTMNLADYNLRLSGSNDEGTFSAMLSMAGGERRFIWWNPIDQLSLFFGKDGDGLFNSSGNTRWGFHKGTMGTAIENWDNDGIFLGNWDPYGFAVVVKPIDGLALNVAVPLTAPMKLEDLAHVLQVQAVYGFDLGTVYVTWQGKNASNGPKESFGITLNSSSLVDGFEFELGFRYKYTENGLNPMGIGLFVGYDGGEFGAKLRAFIYGFDSYAVKMDIMPWYDLGFITAYLNVRLQLAEGADVGWHVNPYIVYPAGAASFRAGILFGNQGAGFTGLGTDVIYWQVPIGLSFSF